MPRFSGARRYIELTVDPVPWDYHNCCIDRTVVLVLSTRLLGDFDQGGSA